MGERPIGPRLDCDMILVIVVGQDPARFLSLGVPEGACRCRGLGADRLVDVRYHLRPLLLPPAVRLVVVLQSGRVIPVDPTGRQSRSQDA